MCYFTTATRTAVINWHFFPFIFSVFKMRMSKFFFQLVIVIHVFACAWYCLACPLNECYREENWVKHQGNSFHQLRDKLDSSTWRLINFSGKKYLIFLLRKYCTRSWLTSVLDRMKIADIPDSIPLSFFSKYKQNRFLRLPHSNEHHNCFNRSYAPDLLHWFCCFLTADLLDAPALTRYCTAVYWVVATMTSTGYGDIHGDNSYEMGEKSE